MQKKLFLDPPRCQKKFFALCSYFEPRAATRFGQFKRERLFSILGKLIDPQRSNLSAENTWANLQVNYLLRDTQEIDRIAPDVVAREALQNFESDDDAPPPAADAAIVVGEDLILQPEVCELFVRLGVCMYQVKANDEGNGEGNGENSKERSHG